MRKGARLGQHFLKNFAYAGKLAAAAGVAQGDTVLEIGPGKGVLTKALLHTGAHVIAIEKDPMLVRILQEKFAEEIAEGRLEIREGDIRDFDPRTITGDYVLAANIPYYITGEIIRAFLTTDHQPRTMVLLVQKEVAERIISAKESILSLSVKAYGRPRIAARVNRKHFSPPPSVDSAILAIEDTSKTFFDGISEEQFFKVVRGGFASKRKMLAGNLTRVFAKEKVSAAFDTCGIAEKSRAEGVNLSQWKCLTATLQER